MCFCNPRDAVTYTLGRAGSLGRRVKVHDDPPGRAQVTMRPDVELPASQFGPDDVRIAQAPIAVILATLNTPIMNTWDGSVIHPPPYQIGGETLKNTPRTVKLVAPIGKQGRSQAPGRPGRSYHVTRREQAGPCWRVGHPTRGPSREGRQTVRASRRPSPGPLTLQLTRHAIHRSPGLEKHGNSRHRASGRSRWPPLCAARSPCRRMMRRVEARMWR